MKISCKETVFTYNVYHMVKAFFPEAEIEQYVDAGQEPLVKLELDGGSCFCVLPADVRGRAGMQAKKREVTRLVYHFLSEMTGKELAWGMLTGVRPTKLAMQIVARERSEERAVDVLQRDYAVAPPKAKLAVEIAEREKALLAPLDIHQGFSLYVGIPFCPSICSYCSFGSLSVDLWKGQMDAYLDALCKELAVVAVQMRGQKLNTIYIGGGTPTTLEPGQLERLLCHIDDAFAPSHGGGEPSRIYRGGGAAGQHHAGKIRSASFAPGEPHFHQSADDAAKNARFGWQAAYRAGSGGKLSVGKGTRV